MNKITKFRWANVCDKWNSGITQCVKQYIWARVPSWPNFSFFQCSSAECCKFFFAIHSVFFLDPDEKELHTQKKTEHHPRAQHTYMYGSIEITATVCVPHTTNDTKFAITYLIYVLWLFHIRIYILYALYIYTTAQRCKTGLQKKMREKCGMHEMKARSVKMYFVGFLFGWHIMYLLFNACTLNILTWGAANMFGCTPWCCCVGQHQTPQLAYTTEKYNSVVSVQRRYRRLPKKLI